MSTLFISDLHLSPDKPELTQTAIDFLKQKTQDVTRLYILGDLFNTWLGDDIVPDEFQGLINCLYQLKQTGIATFLMVGNRDFMIGKDFAQRCGCSLLADPTIIELDNTKVLLMHGDSLCIDDVSYQRYRRWTRSRFLQWCFLALSANYRQGISDKIKQKSRQQKQFKSSMIMDVNPGEVSRIMSKHNIDYLLHGHTHRPAFHQLTTGHRIVLGDWDNHVSYLKYDQQQFQLCDPRVAESNAILKLA